MNQTRLVRSGHPELAYSCEFPSGAPRAVVLWTHGFGEHSGRYDHVARVWRERGIAVCRYDLRGHGRSAGERGYVPRFSDFVADAQAVLDEVYKDDRAQRSGKAIVYGHSLGALISIHLALTLPERFRGLALTSPYLGLSLPVPALKKHVGRWVSNVWPTFAQDTNIRGADLTHDPEVSRLIDADPLGVHKITARCFTEVEAAQASALERAPELRLPVFCLAAGDDRIVSLATTEAWFERVGATQKELEVVPHGFHELLNEAERAQHIERLCQCFESWL